MYTAFGSGSIKSGSRIMYPKLRVPTSERSVLFYTCLNLGQLSPHNFKNLHDHPPGNLNPKIYNLL
jgi:hypothetical protein